MNERIRELADNAELTIHTSIGTYMSHPEFNKKFAELIVQQCIAIIHEQDRIPVEYLYAKPAFIHELAIKKYFEIDVK